ncbi:hypothetical protein HPB50_023259 [Hyalomma asiaticum]|uniref:Uncharacterized protein n=1 Tax=Hyalomma asiaticum TaxID=266040 RepID=A0ACB7SC54_HYAAI|nr:hypothetical protein HPB50_023259 [Hyalomma asiaticum]
MSEGRKKGKVQDELGWERSSLGSQARCGGHSGSQHELWSTKGLRSSSGGGGASLYPAAAKGFRCPSRRRGEKQGVRIESAAATYTYSYRSSQDSSEKRCVRKKASGDERPTSRRLPGILHTPYRSALRQRRDRSRRRVKSASRRNFLCPSESLRFKVSLAHFFAIRFPRPDETKLSAEHDRVVLECVRRFSERKLENVSAARPPSSVSSSM